MRISLKCPILNGRLLFSRQGSVQVVSSGQLQSRCIIFSMCLLCKVGLKREQTKQLGLRSLKVICLGDLRRGQCTGAVSSIILIYAHKHKGMPLKPRTLLYPILKERILTSKWGAAADVFCI